MKQVSVVSMLLSPISNLQSLISNLPPPFPQNSTHHSQGVQTMYRESAAQTDPFSPDFIADEDDEVSPPLFFLG